MEKIYGIWYCYCCSCQYEIKYWMTLSLRKKSLHDMIKSITKKTLAIKINLKLIFFIFKSHFRLTILKKYVAMKNVSKF